MTLQLLLVLTAVRLLPVCFHSRLLAAPGDEYWDDQFGIPGLPGGVATVKVVNGQLLVGGRFSRIGEVEAANIAKWEGSKWSAVTLGFDPRKGGSVLALAASDDLLYAGGYFSEVAGIKASNIAKWNGSTWSSLGDGINGAVFALAIIGTNLYAGGKFSMAAGRQANSIARWNGKEWSPLGSGVGCTNDFPLDFNTCDGAVYGLVADGDKLYVGGQFNLAGGNEIHNIAVWDGLFWSALQQGIRYERSPPYDGTVHALALMGSDLIVGGGFRFAGPNRALSIARWDGRTWHPLGSGFQDALVVQALAVSGGWVYVAARYFSTNGQIINRVFEWDGRVWTPLGSTIVPIGRTQDKVVLAPFDSQLFVGGAFKMAGNKPSTNIALWHIPQTLQVRRSGDTLALSWPAPDTNFVLEATGNLSGTNWAPVQTQPALQRNRLTVTEKIFGPQKFYRLRQR